MLVKAAWPVCCTGPSKCIFWEPNDEVLRHRAWPWKYRRGSGPAEDEPAQTSMYLWTELA